MNVQRFPAKRILLLVFGLTLAALSLLPLARRAGAEHFDMILRVEAGMSRGEAAMDTTPPIGGVNRRAVVTAKTGETVSVSWHLKSGFPHGVMKAATVHFFVVREGQIGQKPVPDPAGKNGVVDNKFVMDFAPKSEASGSLRFAVSQSGAYLIRIQSEDTHEEHGHEHFAAVDLKID